MENTVGGEKRKLDSSQNDVEEEIEREEKLSKVELPTTNNTNEIIVPFHFEEDKCDYTLITKDKSFLSFYNMLVKTL